MTEEINELAEGPSSVYFPGAIDDGLLIVFDGEATSTNRNLVEVADMVNTQLAILGSSNQA